MSVDGADEVQLVQSPAAAVRRDRLIRLAEVERVTGLKKSNLYLLMKRGAFPPSIRLTGRCVCWPETQVLQWVQDRIAGVPVDHRQAADLADAS